MSADLYARRPQTVRARQWRGDNETEVRALTGYFEALDEPSPDDPDATAQLLTDPHSTWELMRDGDWVVVFPGNIVTRMSDERFRTDYEPAAPARDCKPAHSLRAEGEAAAEAMHRDAVDEYARQQGGRRA